MAGEEALAVQVLSLIVCGKVYHGTGLHGGGGAVQRVGDTPTSFHGGREWTNSAGTELVGTHRS